jgi:hypothetical protein
MMAEMFGLLTLPTKMSLTVFELGRASRKHELSRHLFTSRRLALDGYAGTSYMDTIGEMALNPCHIPALAS